MKRTPTFRAPVKASLQYHDHHVYIALSSWKSGHGNILVEILLNEPYRVPSMAQICNSSLPPLSTVENPYVKCHCPKLFVMFDIESTDWLELLCLFTGVKNLHLSEKCARFIICALEEVVKDRMTEILPALQEMFVERSIAGHNWMKMEQFLAAWELSGNPVVVSPTGKYKGDWWELSVFYHIHDLCQLPSLPFFILFRPCFDFRVRDIDLLFFLTSLRFRPLYDYGFASDEISLPIG